MALTTSELAIVRQIITAWQNGKRLNELPEIDGTNPFDLITEVLDVDGESKQAKLASLLPYLESECAYGIEFDTTVSSPPCTHIGNSDLHRSLPIQSRMKGCLFADDGTVNEYLNPSNWEAHDLTGASGQVKVELPAHYRKFVTDSTVRQVWLSEYPLPGYHYVAKSYISAYEATLERSTGQLCSVVNMDADYRGGNNNADYDDTYRSFLGRPVTQMSRTAFRSAARLRSNTSEWNCQVYEQYKTLYWLFVVEYATLNTQDDVNSEKDANGYRQGGLGNGATTLNSTKWNNFNGYYPFLPCGYTNELGNSSGEIAFTMPEEYDASGEGNYTGAYNSAASYTEGQFISDGDTLYKCIADADAGTELTNTTYFDEITRTVVFANRYRGIENIFGHMWKWTDGINIEILTDADGGTSKVYIASDPADFSDSGYVNYENRGLEARSNGWVTAVLFGEFGDIMPEEVGGGSTVYFCDYHYTSLSSSSLRGVLFGGSAYNGAFAGFGCALSINAPSSTSAYIGSRLCFLPE